jgi:hypothetical protein
MNDLSVSRTNGSDRRRPVIYGHPPFVLASASPDDPPDALCGLDLDYWRDADFINFFASTEGLLPMSLVDLRRESAFS